MTNFTNCPFQNHERIDFIYINYENTSSPVESKLHVCICAIAHLSLHFVRFSGYVISNVHRLSTVRASLSSLIFRCMIVLSKVLMSKNCNFSKFHVSIQC